MNLKTKNILISILIINLGCSRLNIDFNGFWEGPHPTNSTKKFYIQIQKQNDTLKAKGYWTKNTFYDSQFTIDSIKLEGSDIRFYVPDWNCYYQGKYNRIKQIEGGFHCEGEPFDPVLLIRKNEVARFLTLPKADYEINYKYHYNEPEKSEDLLETSFYSSDRDSLFINQLITDIVNGDYGRLNAFLLLKNNQLICEEYFYGYARNDLHQIESSTKSITSLLIGIAKDQGFINNINEALFEIYPEYEHLKTNGFEQIKLNHILSMTSGFVPNDDKIFRGGDDRITASLNRELKVKPGEKFIYDGGNTEILGAIIKRKTKSFADEFANQYLFSPLKIADFNWEIYKQDGYPSMAGSLWLKPRDMAKIGLMVLNEGQFNGRQIVSKEWICESTSKKIKTHIQGDDYAYHWWNINLKSNGKTYQCIWANGLGSQFIYIIPELKVVIVTTGHNYENDSWAIKSGIEKSLYLLE